MTPSYCNKKKKQNKKPHELYPQLHALNNITNYITESYLPKVSVKRLSRYTL